MQFPQWPLGIIIFDSNSPLILKQIQTYLQANLGSFLCFAPEKFIFDPKWTDVFFFFFMKMCFCEVLLCSGEFIKLISSLNLKHLHFYCDLCNFFPKSHEKCLPADLLWTFLWESRIFYHTIKQNFHHLIP